MGGLVGQTRSENLFSTLSADCAAYFLSSCVGFRNVKFNRGVCAQWRFFCDYSSSLSETLLNRHTRHCHRLTTLQSHSTVLISNLKFNGASLMVPGFQRPLGAIATTQFIFGSGSLPLGVDIVFVGCSRAAHCNSTA
eukprot:COSAG05_NODE_490_length_9314_cov_95.649702_4_plen_137_part_00